MLLISLFAKEQFCTTKLIHFFFTTKFPTLFFQKIYICYVFNGNDVIFTRKTPRLIPMFIYGNANGAVATRKFDSPIVMIIPTKEICYSNTELFSSINTWKISGVYGRISVDTVVFVTEFDVSIVGVPYILA